MQFKSWGSCIPHGGNAVAGECLSEVTVTLRAKFRNYLQAVVEKLMENVSIVSAFFYFLVEKLGEFEMTLWVKFN